MAITCADYTLTAKRGPGKILFEITVTGTDGKFYKLQVNKVSDRKQLVQDILAKLSEIWPSPGWDFEADAQNVITKVV